MSTRTTKRPPRGIRNNNPLNIRIGNTWLGEVPNPTDSEFEQFVSVRYGLRAGFIILRRYIRRYGRNTIKKIISAWAPANENATDLYIKFVAHRLSIDPDTPIHFSDIETMCRLVGAMARYECGQDVPEGEILIAYNMT